MARKSFGANVTPPKAPSFSGGSNPLMTMMMAQSMLPDKERVKTEAKVEEEKQLVPVSAEKAAEQKVAERTVETAPSRAVMKQTLIKAKQLADQVPAQKPGGQRLAGGLKTFFKGNVTQQIPQIPEYNNLINSGLTAFARTMFAEKGNVANWDIQRVRNAFSNIEWDTEDVRALSFNRAIDVYNDVMGSYKTIPQEELIDKREMLTPKEFGRARFLSGDGDFSDLTDDELAAITEDGEDSLNMVHPQRLQQYIDEIDRREKLGGV